MKRRKSRLIIYMLFAAVIPVMFAGCELVLGNGETPNVTLDLGQIFGGGRSITPPAGIAFTEIVVTVYGQGMTTIQKTVSPGARYLNMYVPAGPDRRFKVEAFFNITNPAVFTRHHLRSYIGRAETSLSPGRIVRLVFNMVAGSTMYLVPDYGNHEVFYSNDLYSFSVGSTTSFNLSTAEFSPIDIEISEKGTIFAANFFADPKSYGISYATKVDDPGAGSIPDTNAVAVIALAMDRNARQDINGDETVDTSILYYTTGTQLFFTVVDSLPPTQSQVMNLEDRITAILGMAVDPWTHLLYMSGVCDGVVSIIVYDPFATSTGPDAVTLFGKIVATQTDSRFRSLFDVTVTDTAVYVLNVDVTGAGAPSVMEFDRDLKFNKSFGSVSWDSGNFVPSTAPGRFYIPIRFVAQENAGLTIIDDSNLSDPFENDYDKIVHINTDLDPSSWTTFPQTQQPDGPAGEDFRFLY